MMLSSLASSTLRWVSNFSFVIPFTRSLLTAAKAKFERLLPCELVGGRVGGSLVNVIEVDHLRELERFVYLIKILSVRN